MENNPEVVNKSNKKIIIIVSFLILIIVGLIGYICYDKGVFGKKNNIEPNVNENSSIEKQNNDNIVYSSIYGFAYVYKNEKEYKMMALNSNGSDIELNSGQGSITFYIKNNKLLYTNTRANSNSASYIQKVYYIDLDDKSYKPMELASGIGIYDYFDFNSNYLFSRNGLDDIKGIVRYDLNTKEKIIFEKDVYANGFFINDNKLYYYYTDYSFSNSNTPVDLYYTIDFDGKNKKSITKEEYDKVVSDSGYKEEIGTYNDVYFIKNNKKVYIDKELHNLYLDDKIVYTSSNTSRSIVLEYSEDPNIICFREVTMNTGEVPLKSYFYHIDTDKLEEINENQVISFREIIK